MNKKKSSAMALKMLCFLMLIGCNRFHKTRLLESFSYYADECAKRDITHHANSYSNGMRPSRACIHYREFMCRIERICVGKSEIENESCRQDARNYWGQDERKPKICDNATK